MKGITRIKVKGRLDKKWKHSFDGMDVNYDEASLHGILNMGRD
jgi:hypothetical protein